MDGGTLVVIAFLEVLLAMADKWQLPVNTRCTFPKDAPRLGTLHDLEC